MKYAPNKSSGFTLVELTVVILTLAILFAISTIAYDSLQASVSTTKTKANANQAKKIADIFNSENSAYPNSTQQFYLGGVLAKLPLGVSIIADSASTKLNSTIGSNTMAYACMTSCSGGAISGGRLSYWDFASNSTKYIYVGSATSASSWDYPRSLKSVVSGGSSSCSISDVNTTYCWGGNSTGQIGSYSNTSTLSSGPVAVDTTGVLMNRNITSLALGNTSVCVVVTAGRAYCWGTGSYGELGTGTLTKSVSPQSVFMSGTLSGKTVKSVSGGIHNMCSIASDDKAYCWGDDTYGQLGNNSNTNSSVPVAVYTGGVLNGKTITKMATGGYHTCVIANDNKAYCWGHGGYGQLGNSVNTDSSVPVAVNTAGVLSGKTLTSISAGQFSTCALDSAGKAYCWGNNDSGMLGNNSETDANVPVAVVTTGALSGRTLASISVGSQHTCALDSAGKAYCWGWDGMGEFGKSVTNDYSMVPVLTDEPSVLTGKFINRVSASWRTTCFGTTDGITACTGENLLGQLGVSSPDQSWIPLAIDTSKSLNGMSTSMVTLTNNRFGCVVASNNRLYCWGNNGDGQLGSGPDNNVDKSSPILISTGPLVGKTIQSISLSEYHACAIASDNNAYCWGSNSYGEIGDGTGDNEAFKMPSAVDTSGAFSGKTVKAITAGDNFTCAIASDDKAYCWGYNDYYQLGDGTTNYSAFSPVAVVTTGVLSGKTVKAISSGGYHTCVIASDDKPYCWGYGDYGQLGNSANGSSNVPVAVTMTGALSGKTVKSIATGAHHTCVIASDNKPYCWGYGGSAALGNNGVSDSNIPVAVTMTGALSGKTVKSIATRSYHVCVIASDNRPYCWGYGGNGALGNGAYSSSMVPIAVNIGDIMNNQAVRSISAGNGFSCAVSTINQTFCWGYNMNGQLGNGLNSTTNLPVPVAI
jgi:alpha-tubulin suppressor-like RCC1 family protein